MKNLGENKIIKHSICLDKLLNLVGSLTIGIIFLRMTRVLHITKIILRIQLNRQLYLVRI
jgi:hypothetical protein